MISNQGKTRSTKKDSQEKDNSTAKKANKSAGKKITGIKSQAKNKTTTKKTKSTPRTKVKTTTKGTKGSSVKKSASAPKTKSQAKNKTTTKKTKSTPRIKSETSTKKTTTVRAKKTKIKEPSEKEIEKKKKSEIQRLAKEEKKKVDNALSDSLARQMLIDLGGENALTIIRNFSKDLSDDDIAKKLKLKISDVRATLNRLHSEGIVNYVRARDSETGWYSYSWSLDRLRMERWIIHQAKKYEPMQRTDGEYYFCPCCGVPSIMDFETATDYSFRCCRCNRSMEYVDDEAFEKLNEIFRKRL